MRLLIDQGNTRLKWLLVSESKSVWKCGVFDYHSKPLSALFFELAEEHSVLADEVEQVAVATVAGVGQLLQLQQFSKDYFRQTAWVAHSEHSWANLKNSYSDVSKMGVDRWLACIGAEVAKPQAPKIVVDVGSAITVECLASNGQHLGGYIGPGLRLLQSSLFGGTASIEAEVNASAGALRPGKNTQDAVTAAALQMCVGLVKGALDEMHAIHLEPDQAPFLIFTGGDGRYLQPFFSESVLSPHLVLEGLAVRATR